MFLDYQLQSSAKRNVLVTSFDKIITLYDFLIPVKVWLQIKRVLELFEVIGTIKC